MEKNKLLIIYKLCVDLLFIGIVFFAVSLLAESLIPGIVTSRVGFSKISFLVVLPLLLSSALAGRLGISLAEISGRGASKKALVALVFLMIFVFFSSLFNLNIFLNLFILALALACAYFIFKVVTEEG